MFCAIWAHRFGLEVIKKKFVLNSTEHEKRGKICPRWGRKLKIAFHQFLLVGLLNEYNSWCLFNFTVVIHVVTEMAAKIGLK